MLFGSVKNKGVIVALNEKIYSPELKYKSSSMISGQIEMTVAAGDENLPWDTPLIAAFLADDDIQSIHFCSTNIGFVKTLQKSYKK
jgi:hypothetical protein